MFDTAIDFGFPTEAERLARSFAAKWPTPNVLHAIELCEARRLSWVDVAALFARSYGKAEAEIGG